VSPTFWSWLVLGGVLLVLEAFTPGVAFLWLALSAGFTGALLWLVPTLGWQTQVLVFAGCAVASVGAWLWWRRRWPVAGDPALNQRTAGYVGSEAVLTVGIAGGHGRVRVADASWLAEGPDLPAGTRVRIMGARGTVLLVAPLPENGSGKESTRSDQPRGSPPSA
jgi:membrane protein implicated in regulation of membrane protease activity